MGTSERQSAYAGLPGNELVEAGLRDLEAGRETVPALLVSMAAPRLREAGLDVADTRHPSVSHRLYDALAADDPRTAHARYNALVRRLVRFARAAEHARTG